tara:strand:+ start:429 stop:932 length:504 start_codon:yes stop_codon:yes gene_type:complete
MAIRSVATTSTLEGFRTTFNSLGTDVGDLASLGTTDQSSIVAAINEVNSAVTTAFTIKDSTSTVQQINSGDVLNFASDTNVTATVTATDTVTFGLASTITGLTSVSTGAITASGTVTFSGLAAASTDTDAFLVNDSNVVKTRTGAEVLSDIGGASTGFAIAQAVALG